MIQDIAIGKMGALPDMVLHSVDVRDCAAMHIAVMNDAATDGHRHFSFGMVGKIIDIATVIRKRYSDQGLNPNPGDRSILATWHRASCIGQVGSIYSKLSQPVVYETEWPGVYAYRHRDFEETISASMDSLLKYGSLKPKSVGGRS